MRTNSTRTGYLFQAANLSLETDRKKKTTVWFFLGLFKNLKQETHLRKRLTHLRISWLTQSETGMRCSFFVHHFHTEDMRKGYLSLKNGAVQRAGV